MLNFVIWVSIISTGLAALVFLAILGVVLTSLFDHFRTKGNSHSLPAPDKAAERPWSQRYFERAAGRK